MPRVTIQPLSPAGMIEYSPFERSSNCDADQDFKQGLIDRLHLFGARDADADGGEAEQEENLGEHFRVFLVVRVASC